jgi:hypothetical protein
MDYCIGAAALKTLGGSVINMDGASLMELLALLSFMPLGSIGEWPGYFWTVLAMLARPLLALRI